MKTILTVLLLLTVCCVRGQDYATARPARALSASEHEFRFSAGAFPLFIDDLDEWNYPYDSWGNFESTKYFQGATYTTGAFTASYSYRCKKWNFGLSVSYTHEYYDIYSNIDGSAVKRFNADFISVIPTVRYTWFNYRSLRLYSACGLGVTFLSGDKNKYTQDSAVGIQLTYIGISAGKRFFGFAELGTGAHGTLIGGIGYRFNGKGGKR